MELIGTAFSECFTEPEKASAIYELVFEQGMAVDYPLTMRHRDGTLTEVLYNASVYRDAGGKVLGVFAAARDVTKQNRAQQEIAEQRVNELDRLAELEHFQRLTVGRELKMIELKKEIESLQRFGPGDGGDLGDSGGDADEVPRRHRGRPDIQFLIKIVLTNTGHDTKSPESFGPPTSREGPGRTGARPR